MSIISEYIFSIITILLLLLYFVGLPKLEKIEINKKNKFTRHDLILCFMLTILCLFLDFYKLGNSIGIDSFTSMGGNTAYLEIDENQEVSSVRIFCGVGEGDYIIDSSNDGIKYETNATFNQNYNTVLKWNDIEIANNSFGKYIRVYANGNVYLGELFFLNNEDEIITYSSSKKEFNDEQNKFEKYTDYLNSAYFDEIYHPRTAWEHLNGIYPYETSHPPLGKILIALGISIFGMSPFGWRFSGTLFGVIMIPVIYYFLKYLFQSTRVACCSTLIFATDFMHFVQTRIATIDTYAVFFIVAMYLFMYLYINTTSKKHLALSGIFFGFGAASKWTCIYAGAGLAIIWLIYCLENWQNTKKFINEILFCIPFFIIIPSIIYYLSYIPFGIANNASLFSLKYFQMVKNNQIFMYNYHSNLVAEHPYSSTWYQWIFDIRPILYYLQYYSDGTRSSFGAFNNPVLCWGGIICIVFLLFLWIIKNDKISRFIIIGYLSQLVPWIFVKRLTFEYHYFACTVFLVLAFGYIMKIIEINVKHHKIYNYGITLLSIAIFILFYPAISGKPINNDLGNKILGWLPTWPF